MLIGLLHKARAEVALAMHDTAAFERHFAQMERCFRASRNPSLIAQIERVAAAAVQTGVRSLRPAAGHARALGTTSQLALAELGTATNRCDTALRLIMQASRASSAHLFLLAGDRLELAAASDGTHPPAAVEDRLLREVLRRRHLALDDEVETVANATDVCMPAARSVFIDAAPPHALAHELAVEPGGHLLLVLSTQRSGRTIVVGGVVIEHAVDGSLAIDAELLEPIASALHGRSCAPTARGGQSETVSR